MKYILSMIFIMLITLFTYSQKPGITNKTCKTAIQIGPNTCATYTIETNYGSDADKTFNDISCLDPYKKPSWYYFNTINSGNVSLTIKNNDGNDNNIYALYGPFDNINIDSICIKLNKPFYCNKNNNDSIFLEFNKNYILLLAVQSNKNNANTYKKTISINNKNIIGCTPTVLASTLLSFDGYNDNGFNYLKFVTGSETNIDYYSVEHSDNGYDWKEFDKLLPQYLNKNIYKSIHKPTIVYNYYRLITYDYDHTKTISDPISVRSTLLDIVNRYNLFGQLVDEYYKGIVILEYSNGTLEKIFQ